ncbi:MAG: hypothetical protein NTY19_01360 [Planctomycetota bacterium]|nr:hypothetical protein [Planctomycetota bacterium]
MSKTDGRGIVGLLDQILSTGHAGSLAPSSTGSGPRMPRPEPGPIDSAGTPTATSRRGRPPGKAPSMATPKEKVTLRITSTLVASYRDWSWEARSQLSQLVERALADYHDRQRLQRRSAP